MTNYVRIWIFLSCVILFTGCVSKYAPNPNLKYTNKIYKITNISVSKYTYYLNIKLEDGRVISIDERLVTFFVEDENTVNLRCITDTKTHEDTILESGHVVNLTEEYMQKIRGVE